MSIVHLCKALNFRYNRVLPISEYSTLINKWNVNHVVLSNDKSTIVCWHPEPQFPYEYTLPLPKDAPAENTVLNVQHLEEIRSVFKEKPAEFVREELMKLTCTSKHVWFPKKLRKRAFVKKIEPEREYL